MHSFIWNLSVKDFQNQSTFAEVMTRNQIYYFFPEHGVDASERLIRTASDFQITGQF